ncbi:hypothetical protein J6590_024737 [Homalodisca vitripennis]|nr:hypothetical protein J6590_024737 [Homalodisca vitripennis]
MCKSAGYQESDFPPLQTPKFITRKPQLNKLIPYVIRTLAFKHKDIKNTVVPAKEARDILSSNKSTRENKEPSRKDAKNYKLAKINYKGDLKQAKFNANQEFIQSSSNSCKAAWQIIKHETQPKQKQHATPDADSFNEYFISVVDEI